MNKLCAVLIGFFFLSGSPFLSASITPVPLEQRIHKAEQAVLARLNHQVSYWGEGEKNIYTLYILDVVAYLKGEEPGRQIAVIAQGGRIGQQMQVTYPRVGFSPQHDYLLFLEGDNYNVDHKSYRGIKPDVKQCLPYAGVQGVLPGRDGLFYDIGSQAYYSGRELLRKIEQQAGVKAKTPEGEVFQFESTGAGQGIQGRSLLTITSLTDGTGATPASGFVAGTTDSDNELIINGSGFGPDTDPGIVLFSNADNGGMDFIASSVSSDLISWSENQIRVKIPGQAGTGTVMVRNSSGTGVGSAAITINYAVISSYSTFYNFPEKTRILPKLADIDGNGGYTFQYNNDVPNTTDDFAGHADAVAAFERALNNWRSSTGVNFSWNNAGTANDAPARDGNQVVSFADLPDGTLGAASLYFAGSSTGAMSCEQQNTRWYIEDLDIRFKSNANLVSETGLSWNFDGSPTMNEIDFESVAIHEIGHTHGLGHLIDNSNLKVMHYILLNGEQIRDLSSSETSGGAYLMAQGTAIPPCLPNDPGPMSAVSGPLPIDLLSFEGLKQGNAVALHWQTATETNNDFFTLERSADGQSFEALAKIPGAGDSYSFQHYHYLDKLPLPDNNYYRLSQTDFDGRRSYVDIISIWFDPPRGGRLRVDSPMKNGLLSVAYQATGPGKVALYLFNTAGQLLLQQEKQVEKGNNMWELPAGQIPPGLYYLQLQQGHSLLSERVLNIGH